MSVGGRLLWNRASSLGRARRSREAYRISVRFSRGVSGGRCVPTPSGHEMTLHILVYLESGAARVARVLEACGHLPLGTVRADVLRFASLARAAPVTRSSAFSPVSPDLARKHHQAGLEVTEPGAVSRTLGTLAVAVLRIGRVFRIPHLGPGAHVAVPSLSSRCGVGVIAHRRRQPRPQRP